MWKPLVYYKINMLHSTTAGDTERLLIDPTRTGSCNNHNREVSIFIY